MGKQKVKVGSVTLISFGTVGADDTTSICGTFAVNSVTRSAGEILSDPYEMYAYPGVDAYSALPDGGPLWQAQHQGICYISACKSCNEQSVRISCKA